MKAPAFWYRPAGLSATLLEPFGRLYDLAGRLLKDFRVKDLKKVNGRWQVAMVIMENVQAGTRTQLEFDLKSAE